MYVCQLDIEVGAGCWALANSIRDEARLAGYSLEVRLLGVLGRKNLSIEMQSWDGKMVRGTCLYAEIFAVALVAPAVTRAWKSCFTSLPGSHSLIY